MLHYHDNTMMKYDDTKETSQSSLSPYTCYGLYARRYGLWASQGRELSTELTARTPLILPTSPSYFDNRQAEHVLLYLSLEKTQSLISPYMCYGLRALRYGWSAAVP